MKAETWHATFLIVECTIVVCLNTFLVVMIIFNRKLRSRKCNLFLVNLFLTHIIEGLVGIIRSSVLYSIIKDPTKVSMGVNLFTTAVILSYLTYIPVTLDRYVAIKHPFRYQHLTYKHVFLVNSLIWLTAIIFGATVFCFGMDSKVGDGITFAATLLMFVFCISANVSIYKVVQKQVKKLKVAPSIPDEEYIQQTSAMAPITLHTSVKEPKHNIDNSGTFKELVTEPRNDKGNSETCKQTTTTTDNQFATANVKKVEHNKNTGLKVKTRTREQSVANQKLNTRSLRSLRICTLIVVSFIICWTPHTLHDILKITNAFPQIVYSDSLLGRSTIFVAFCNGIIDPALYVFMNKDLKDLLKRFFSRVSNRVRTNTLQG